MLIFRIDVPFENQIASETNVIILNIVTKENANSLHALLIVLSRLAKVNSFVVKIGLHMLQTVS